MSLERNMLDCTCVLDDNSVTIGAEENGRWTMTSIT